MVHSNNGHLVYAPRAYQVRKPYIRNRGGSVRSAYAVGVNVKMVKMILFMLSALAAGFMGILSLTYFTSMSVDEGQTLPLLTLAVAVIGGGPPH